MKQDDRRAIPRPPVHMRDTEVGLDVELSGLKSRRVTPEGVLQRSEPRCRARRAPSTDPGSIGTGSVMCAHAALNTSTTAEVILVMSLERA
jgi:hypothetical protein